MRSAARLAPAIVALAVAACAKPATKADYDKIAKAMPHAEVDKALEPVSSGKPVDAKDVLDTYGGMDTTTYHALEAVKLFRWGTKTDALWVGFGPHDEARIKVLKTPHSSALEHLGLRMVNGISPRFDD